MPITPLVDGTVTVSVAANVAKDADGHTNQAGSKDFTADLTPPTLAIQGPAGAVTGGFQITFAFSEPVTDFAQDDIVLTAGTLTDPEAVSPQDGYAATFTATFTPTISGQATVNVAADKATDEAGNGNLAATEYQVQVALAPRTVSYGAATYTATENGADALVIVTLDQATDRALTIPITVTGGTGEAADYNVTLASPHTWDAGTGTGTVSFAVGESSQQIAVTAVDDTLVEGNETLDWGFGATLPDGVGAGAQSTTTVKLVDDDRAELTVSYGADSYTATENGTDATVTVSLSAVADREVRVPITTDPATGDFRLPVNEVVFAKDEQTKEITVEATDDADLEDETVELGFGTLPTNVSAGAQSTTTVNLVDDDKDQTRPTVVITTEASEPVGGPFEVTIRFSEAVDGFVLGDISVTNGMASNFNRVSKREYTATITPEESGEVKVEVGENVAEDAANNGNKPAEPFTIQADLKGPEVEITSEATGPVEGPFEVTIIFEEPVKGFELEDIQVTNGTASDFTQVSAQVYTATITPQGMGKVKVEVGENVAEDEAGNGNEEADPFIIDTALQVSFESETYTAVEGGEAVTVKVTLSRAVEEEMKIPIRVTRPEGTEVDDYQVEELEEWDAEQGAGSLTFPSGETEGVFTIEANRDADGEDEQVELGFGELPEGVMLGEPAMATVTLEDKGLLDLKVSFEQAEYTINEGGEEARIEIRLSPAADRRVVVPLKVTPQGGATSEDYRGVPEVIVFEAGSRVTMIEVAALSDEVNDPGEGIGLGFGELPEAVSGGEISETTVHFTQYRTAEQFSRTLEVMLAVIARSMGESAQTAIEGRFERYRQWSRMEQTPAGGSPGPTTSEVLGTPRPAMGEAVRAGARVVDESGWQRRGASSVGSSLEGVDVSGSYGDEDAVPPSGGATPSRPATGSTWDSAGQEGGIQGSWLKSYSLGSLASMAHRGQPNSGFSNGYGMGPSGRGYGPDRLRGSGTSDSFLRSESGEFSGMRNQGLNLAGASFEMSLGGQNANGKGKSWVPVLWGQGDLQYFNGNLTRIGMNYRGGLNAAHVGMDLYADEHWLAGLAFMRSWGTMDYTDDGVDGVLDSGMNTFHPYLYWQPNDRFSAWVMGGLGAGRVDVNEPGRSHDFNADFRMLSGGMRSVVAKRGNTELGVVLDSFTASLGTDALDDIAKVRGEAHRTRMMLELVHDKSLSAGRLLSVKVEVGGRHDEGDADRGTGVETGFRLGYLDANSGVDVALLGRTLVVHESGYRDWGLGVQASWDPGVKQRGLRVSVTSTRGQDGGGRTSLWNNAHGLTRPMGMGAPGMGSQSRMESEVVYGGMKVLGIRSPLTPYSRLRWAGQGRELAMGAQWTLPARSQLALPFMLELEGIRQERRTGPANLGVLLRMSIPF